MEAAALAALTFLAVPSTEAGWDVVLVALGGSGWLLPLLLWRIAVSLGWHLLRFYWFYWVNYFFTGSD